MEKITYWSDGKLVSKKFRNMAEMKKFVEKNHIVQYYWYGYCFLDLR